MLVMTLLATGLEPGSVTWGLAMLALAVTLGLALGAIRIRGIRLGVSGVLFSALLFGQFGFSVNAEALDFVRDFALIVFVYAIGLAVGPGFLASLRNEGLKLNGLSLLVIVLGALLALAVVRLFRLPAETAVGLYAGAYNTTPGLGAGQQALGHLLADQPEKMRRAAALAGLAYAVTYPFGLVGPTLAIVALRRLFRIRMQDEAAQLAAVEQARRPSIEVANFEVTQPEQAGKPLRSHPLVQSTGVYFSRLLRDNVLCVPTGDTVVCVGDHYRAIGTQAGLGELVRAMGRPSTADLEHAAGDVHRRDLLVTRTDVLRHRLRDLDLIRRTAVAIVRVHRAGVDLMPRASLRLQFGDRVTVVSSQHGIEAMEDLLGNSPKLLNHAPLAPIFLGIVLGVLAGSIPLWVPGMRSGLQLGLAGGSLIAAIALSQLGSVGSVVWYMPVAANELCRDAGLAVFLACIGLRSGDHFVQRLNQQGGLLFVLFGAIITIVPTIIIALIARLRMKMNFITLSGWLAGAMGSSPALLFANEIAGSEAPAVPYAAVAPLADLLPIICAQLLVVFM
jgi:putative transport protein